MLAILIHLLILLVILGLVWWAATTILGVLPLPAPIKTVCTVILIVILCIIVIYALLPLAGGAIGLGHA